MACAGTLEGLTFGTTLSFFPWLYSDLAIALSSLWSTLGSSFWKAHASTTTNARLPKGLTEALVTVNSTSPLAAPIKVSNFSQTPSKMPNRLLSAKVLRKFFTVSPLSAPPVCLSNSWMIWDLSPGLRVGAERILGSFASFRKTSANALSAFEVLSREEVFAAAVYCTRRLSQCLWVGHSFSWSIWKGKMWKPAVEPYQSTCIRSIEAKQCDRRFGVRWACSLGVATLKHQDCGSLDKPNW